MKNLYKALLFTLTLLSINETYASHLAGGQITWTCQPNGKYRFKMSKYQMCEGGNASDIGSGPIDICVWNHPTINSITLQEGANREISLPGCKGALTAIKCGNNNIGAVQEILYESADIDLGNYTPGVNGWWFTYTSCCYPSGTINVFETGFNLRSAMYAYNGNKAKPCYDNSPVFTELPVGIIAKGQTFSYNPNANDADWDSVSVEWGKPMYDTWVDGSYPSCPTTNNNNNEWKLTMPNIQHYAYTTFNAPYTFNNPIGAVQVGALPLLDSVTGSFNFSVPNTVPSGIYASTIKTTAFRSGVKIAEVYRSYLFNIYPQQTNAIPTIAPVQFVKNGVVDSTAYVINVTAGDLVEFDITAQDTITQQHTLTTTGLQYGTFASNNIYNPATLSLQTPCNTPPCLATAASGCATPPCAQFSFTSKNPFTPTVGVNTGYAQVGGHFSWQTACMHVKNLTLAGVGGTNTQTHNTFQFMFKSIDNMCPVSGFKYQPIIVNVYADTVNIFTTSSTQKNELCYGDANGSAVAIANGGIPPYTYNWATTPPQTNDTMTNVVAGNYSCTVTDAKGCISVINAPINQPNNLLAWVATTNPSCGTCNDGQIISFVPSGGTPPYTHSWNTSPIQINDTLAAISAGTYAVTVTDSNRCAVTNNVVLLSGITNLIGTTNTIKYKIYPSVAVDKLSVEIASEHTSPIHLYITSADGKQLIAKNYKTNTINETLDISTLTAGVYFISIATDSEKITRKFIKE
ncbi:MAG: T9SS type A sorting domain-containing protein [Bacteroidia bacterium]